MKIQKNEKVKAYIGQGENRIEFKMPIERAQAVLRLQSLFRRQREEREAAICEGREPRLNLIKY